MALLSPSDNQGFLEFYLKHFGCLGKYLLYSEINLAWNSVSAFWVSEVWYIEHQSMLERAS